MILYPGKKQDYVELYDLEQDPSEKINRNADRPDERTDLLTSLRDWLDLGRGEAVAPELDPSSQMIFVEAELQVPEELRTRVQSGLVVRVTLKTVTRKTE